MLSSTLRFALIACIAGGSLVAPALGGAKDDFYKAYYLQNAAGDTQAALDLYAEVADDRDAPKEMRTQARGFAAECREALAADNLARLFPAETIVYGEINQPGGHLERLLNQIGLVGTAEDAAGKDSAHTVRISPTLLHAFSRFRGAAFAITGFNPLKQQPQWVAVIDPGQDEVIRGTIETAVASMGKPGNAIGDTQIFTLDLDGEEVTVGMGRRLVFVSQQAVMVRKALERLNDGDDGDSLADSDVLGTAIRNRKDAMVFVAADFQKVQGLVHNAMMMGGAKHEIAIAQAVVDFKSFRSLVFQAGVSDNGLVMQAGLDLEKGHHSLALNFLRTPALTRDTLHYVPYGSAVVMMAALSEQGGDYPGSNKADAIRQFTGLDIGREFFANIQEVSIFVTPGAAGDGEGRSKRRSGPPIPDMGLVMTVRDTSRSEAIWTSLLGLVSLASGQTATADETINIGDTEVHVYEAPEGVRICFAATKNAIIVTPGEDVMRAALAAGKNESDSLLRDEEFETVLKSFDENTSKVCMVHAGRALGVAKQFMDPGDLAEIAPIESSLQSLIACISTHESPNALQFNAAVTGLPDVGKLIGEMGVLDMARGRHHHAKGMTPALVAKKHSHREEKRKADRVVDAEKDAEKTAGSH